MSAFSGTNPFAGGGNPFGSGGLKGGLSLLKKKATPKAFEEWDMRGERSVEWKKTVTVRMRDIDTYRLHVPEENERKKYHIPESSDRVNIQDQKQLMVLCGGYAGVRFSSEDLVFIKTKTHHLNEKFTCLDSYFKTLPSAVKRISLSEEDISDHTQSQLEDNSEGNVKVIEERVEESDDISNKNEYRAVFAFHEMADDVLAVLKDIQDLVKRKHAEFQNVSTEDLACDEIMGQDGEADESLSSKPRPVWLETLISKYNREVVKGNKDSTKLSDMGTVPPPLPPIGSLCAFLSCCVIHLVATTGAEYEALVELIHASSDFAAGSVGNTPKNIDDEIFSHTQKYWAQRFFVFMKKLTELKTAPKDEKSVLLFDRFT